jgi:hypothetical protein
LNALAALEGLRISRHAAKLQAAAPRANTMWAQALPAHPEGPIVGPLAFRIKPDG